MIYVMTFEKWLEKLEEKNPYINWEMIPENIINELRTAFEEKENIKCSQ